MSDFEPTVGKKLKVEKKIEKKIEKNGKPCRPLRLTRIKPFAQNIGPCHLT